jgi:hypothetical protein
MTSTIYTLAQLVQLLSISLSPPFDLITEMALWSNSLATTKPLSTLTSPLGSSHNDVIAQQDNETGQWSSKSAETRFIIVKDDELGLTSVNHDKLFVGSRIAAQNINLLRRHSIALVVSVEDTQIPLDMQKQYYDAGIKWLHVPMDDSMDQDLREPFAKIHRAIRLFYIGLLLPSVFHEICAGFHAIRFQPVS